jgi:hypothetical protein
MSKQAQFICEVTVKTSDEQRYYLTFTSNVNYPKLFVERALWHSFIIARSDEVEDVQYRSVIGLVSLDKIVSKVASVKESTK